MSHLSEVNVKNLNAAVEAALKGPERKKIKIARHEFNVKPAKITRENGDVIIDGGDGRHISHHISMSPDDQVMYKAIRHADGTFEIDPTFLNRWKAWIPELVATLKTASDIAKTVGAVLKADGGLNDEIMQSTAHLLDGSWKGEAKFLIAQIALRAQ
jgi:hypothetical protein